MCMSTSLFHSYIYILLLLYFVIPVSSKPVTCKILKPIVKIDFFAALKLILSIGACRRVSEGKICYRMIILKMNNTAIPVKPIIVVHRFNNFMKLFRYFWNSFSKW